MFLDLNESVIESALECSCGVNGPEQTRAYLNGGLSVLNVLKNEGRLDSEYADELIDLFIRALDSVEEQNNQSLEQNAKLN